MKTEFPGPATTGQQRRHYRAIMVICSALAFLCLLPTTSALSTPRQERSYPIGRVTQLDRTKLDKASDSAFYASPRLVTHTDDNFIAQLTALYEEVLPRQGGVILDLMSSHVSHLPPDRTFDRVDVHGMNRVELESNPARKATNGNVLIRNLNENPSLLGLCDIADEYDAVLCCVGIQYLQEPEAVLAEVSRVLRPGGVCVISFTNRFFFQKALTGWMERGMKGRARLVQDYLRAAGGFEAIEIRGDGTNALRQVLSLGGLGGDPFVAVMARRASTG